jgi:hypothetical protein
MVVLLLTILFRVGAADAQSPAGLVGWEKESEYNDLYEASEMDQFKGVIESIGEVVPLPGMDPGVSLTVKDQDGEEVRVQVGPKSFVNLDSIGLRKGDKVKIRGVWAEIDDKEVFLASKIKKGEAELKVRKTSDGTPYWTMTAEELATEKKQLSAEKEE